MLRFIVATSMAAAVLASGLDALARTSITGCGQILADGEKAVLEADLDCAGQPRVCLPPAAPTPCTDHEQCTSPSGPANCSEPLVVWLGSGGRLDLAGHSVSSGHVACAGPGGCKLHGPGSLHDAHVFAARNLEIRNLTFQGNGAGLWSAVQAGGNLDLGDVVVDGTAGVSAGGTARLTDVIVSNGTGPYDAVSVAALIGKNVAITDNATIGLRSLRRTRLVASVITGNGGSSITALAGSVRLVDTVVDQSLLSARSPVLRGSSSCEVSIRLDQDGFIVGTWGACSLDAMP